MSSLEAVSVYHTHHSCSQRTVEDPGGLGGLCLRPPPPFLKFFFTKVKFTSKEIVLNNYEICLKMLEMAILETQIF